MAYLDTHPPKQQQFRDRRRKPTGLIEVHTAETPADLVGEDTSAENVATFIRNRSDYGSYHRLADRDSIVKLIRFSQAAYGDGTGSNDIAIHVAASNRTVDWDRMTKSQETAIVARMAKASAEAARWLKNTHGIVVPAHRISKAESDAGKPGFLGHGDRDPGRRSDPGKTFDWDQFLTLFAVEMGYDTKTGLPKAAAKPRPDKAQATRRLILKAEQQAKRDGVGTPAQRAALKAVRVGLRPKKK